MEYWNRTCTTIYLTMNWLKIRPSMRSEACSQLEGMESKFSSFLNINDF